MFTLKTDAQKHIFDEFTNEDSLTTIKSVAGLLVTTPDEVIRLLLAKGYSETKIDAINRRPVYGSSDYLTRAQFEYYLKTKCAKLNGKSTYIAAQRYFKVKSAKLNYLIKNVYTKEEIEARFVKIKYFKANRYNHEEIAEQIRTILIKNPTVTHKALSEELNIGATTIQGIIKEYHLRDYKELTGKVYEDYTCDTVSKLIKDNKDITSVAKLATALNIKYNQANSLLNHYNLKKLVAYNNAEARHERGIQKRKANEELKHNSDAKSTKREELVMEKTGKVEVTSEEYKAYIRKNYNKLVKDIALDFNTSRATISKYNTKLLDSDISKTDIIEALRTKTFSNKRQLAYYAGVRPDRIQYILDEYDLEVIYSS